MVIHAAIIAAPILLSTLLVGVFVSIIQVTTQIQEITLSYVPKILVSAGLLVVLGPWMLRQLVSFATALYRAIPTLGL